MVDEIKETIQIPVPNVFVNGIDGSEGSHNAFEVVTKDLWRVNVDKIVLVHIYNSSKEHELGPTYKPKYIYNKYISELDKLVPKSDYSFIMEDRKTNENVLEQVYEISSRNNGTLLVIGFRGYKGAKNRPDELSKAVTYLVHKPQIPCLVIKELTSRMYRINGQFKWLVCLENLESKSFKALENFMKFIDVENDSVHGINVYQENKRVKGSKCPVQSIFEEKMTNLGIKNFEFTPIVQLETDQTVYSTIERWVAEHLSQESHWIDFMITGYNPQKYNFNRNATNTTIEILKNVQCNLFFDH
jgi:hypothetical protein